MATPLPASILEEHLAPLPMHEEEDVPEGPLHHRWANYFFNVLRVLFPRWFATGNVCIFWDPRDGQRFVAPDVFLAEGHVPEPPPRSYRAWRLPRVIFAVEIGSVSTAEKGPKLDRYAEQIRPREVLYTEPVDEEKGERLTAEDVHLYRWSGSRYEEVALGADGRHWSTVLECFIGVDEGRNLRVYDRAGVPLLNYEELNQALKVAEAQTAAEAERREAAEAARQEAERRAAAEERTRQEAEQRVVAEERARQEAEQRAAAAARARQEAEQRAAAEERARQDADRRVLEAEERARVEAEQRTAAEERARDAERRLAELLAERERDRS